MAEERDELLEHNYDGIKEYDNNLPRWWVYLFWVTVIFSVVYPLYFDFGPGEFVTESIGREVEALQATRLASDSQKRSRERDEATLLALQNDGAVLSQGKEIYVAKCAACHAAEAQGFIGPNLVDDHWLHGGKIEQIRHTIRKGVPEKGMLAWEALLGGDEIDAVTVYLWTLHGTNPPNPKAPEGELQPREK